MKPAIIIIKRRKYERAAIAEFKRVLNGYLADYMVRVANAQNFADLITEADKPIKSEPINEAMQKLYSRVGTDFAKSTIKDLQKRYAKKSMRIETDFWAEYFRQYARTKLGQKITWITNTTEQVFKETVRRVVEQAGEKGLSIYNTAKEIQKEIGFKNAYRAERIARTEIVAASNLGANEGAKNAGIQLRKRWVPIVDNNTRESHISMDGHPDVDLDEPFNVGGELLQYPGDQAGSAENIINCRCGIQHVPALTYQDIINR